MTRAALVVAEVRLRSRCAADGPLRQLPAWCDRRLGRARRHGGPPLGHASSDYV